MEIVKNIHLIPGVVANPYLIINRGGLTLIDAGLPWSAKKILKYVTSLGFEAGDIKNIIITHADSDHVGGLAAIQTKSGGEVLASEIEAQAIKGGVQSRPLILSGIQKLLFSAASVFFRAAPAEVDHILTNGEVLPGLGGLRVIESPGHTPGHISLYDEEQGVLFCGDSLRCPDGRIKVSRGVNTWDEALAWQSAELQAGLGASTVCPGHGDVVREAGVAFQKMFDSRS
jgi:glyoxylase-like metal-dependent hydrolase (beta-lactamase superfamily II)